MGEARRRLEMVPEARRDALDELCDTSVQRGIKFRVETVDKRRVIIASLRCGTCGCGGATATVLPADIMLRRPWERARIVEASRKNMAAGAGLWLAQPCEKHKAEGAKPAAFDVVDPEPTETSSEQPEPPAA